MKIDAGHLDGQRFMVILQKNTNVALIKDQILTTDKNIGTVDKSYLSIHCFLCSSN